MNIINKEELEFLIAIAVTKSELPVPFAFEKDYYITQIIHTLADLKNDYFSLVFTGGTGLAKAHRLVMRMSEDCDFRIQSSQAADELNPSQRRKTIKAFRQDSINTLDTAGFLVDETRIKTRNAGNYMSAFIPYESAYPGNQELRPDVKIEFMAINTKLEPSPKPVTSLIRLVLGDAVPHAEKSINTISLTETAVDKWVALTRRVANTLHRDIRRSDHDLVRHIYDLYYISEAGYLNNTVHHMVLQVINEDAARYKNHNSVYYDNPLAEIKLALEALQKNDVWREHWNRFTENMVLSEDKLSYNDAINNLITHSEPILAYLSKTLIADFNHISHYETSIDSDDNLS